MLSVIENCRAKRYSGTIKFVLDHEQLSLWFVRGSLAHAASTNGNVGWKALEAAKSASIATVLKGEGELPPERTIRVDTVRLLKAMKSSASAQLSPPMHVPVPLHARLRQKFMELKDRISGLKSFETIQGDTKTQEVDGGRVGNRNRSERTILERDPRGSKWTHLSREKQLVLKGDETITTTELMWAGSELWKVLDREINGASENE